MLAPNEPRPVVPLARPDLGEREVAYVTDAVRSGWLSSAGPYVQRFEAAFARLCGVRHAVAVASGTAGLHLALRAAAIGPGAEVIVPSLTFASTAAAVVHAGATPVFVESTDACWCMDPVAVEAAIGPRTRAVLPVHLYGHPADMQAILDVARRRSLFVLEDAAAALGARCRGGLVGSLGHAGCFSFHGHATVTTGAGGMVTTNDPVLAARLRFLEERAMDPRHQGWHPEVGFDYRMANLQAAVGCAQLERSDELQRARAQVLRWYRDELSDVAGVQMNPHMDWADPAPSFVCTVLANGRLTRDALAERLHDAGFETRPFFGLLHEMPPYLACRYQPGRGGGDADRRLALGGINLPSGRHVTPQDIAEVCRIVADFAR